VKDKFSLDSSPQWYRCWCKNLGTAPDGLVSKGGLVVMYDLLVVIVTLVVFGLLGAFVVFCERI
jgi:hypothetical protein